MCFPTGKCGRKSLTCSMDRCGRTPGILKKRWWRWRRNASIDLHHIGLMTGAPNLLWHPSKITPRIDLGVISKLPPESADCRRPSWTQVGPGSAKFGPTSQHVADSCKPNPELARFSQARVEFGHWACGNCYKGATLEQCRPGGPDNGERCSKNSRPHSPGATFDLLIHGPKLA